MLPLFCCYQPPRTNPRGIAVIEIRNRQSILARQWSTFSRPITRIRPPVVVWGYRGLPECTIRAYDEILIFHILQSNKNTLIFISSSGSKRHRPPTLFFSRSAPTHNSRYVQIDCLLSIIPMSTETCTRLGCWPNLSCAPRNALCIIYAITSGLRRNVRCPVTTQQVTIIIVIGLCTFDRSGVKRTRRRGKA